MRNVLHTACWPTVGLMHVGNALRFLSKLQGLRFLGGTRHLVRVLAQPHLRQSPSSTYQGHNGDKAIRIVRKIALCASWESAKISFVPVGFSLMMAWTEFW